MTISDICQTPRKTRDLTDAELEKVAGQFRLLGEPMRLKILQALSCKTADRWRDCDRDGRHAVEYLEASCAASIIGRHYAPEERPVCLLRNKQSSDVEALRTCAQRTAKDNREFKRKETKVPERLGACLLRTRRRPLWRATISRLTDRPRPVPLCSLSGKERLEYLLSNVGMYSGYLYPRP